MHYSRPWKELRKEKNRRQIKTAFASMKGRLGDFLAQFKMTQTGKISILLSVATLLTAKAFV